MIKESAEIIIALTPVLISFSLWRMRPQVISRWVAVVLASAVVGVLAAGFTMMRFSHQCADTEVSCPAGEIPRAWYAGVLDAPGSAPCMRCATEMANEKKPIEFALNELAPVVSAIGAVLCACLSASVLLKFASWNRAIKRQDYRSNA
jgi:hypothetical protein